MFGVKNTDSTASNEVEDWGSYMAAKKAKLEDQYRELANKEFQCSTGLFKGVAIFVNGWTNPCADELRRLMMIHGGIYHHYQRSGSTTHLIASNLPYSKIIQYRKSKNPLPLCKPDWIMDSIKANKLLDWRLYLLYSNTSITQPQLQFENKINPPVSMTINQEVSSNPKLSSNVSSNSENKTEPSPAPAKSESNSEFLKHVKESNSNGTALCSKNDEFLTEFYNNSRLHHISTMGATFKEYVNELRLKSTGSFPGLESLKKMKKKFEKTTAKVENNSESDDDLFSSADSCDKKQEQKTIIMHIDMDCFFVSVGLRNKPELRGFPVAVTHARGNKSSTNSNENEEKFQSMSEIASCSYEARKAGLKNGMFLGQALKLCPNLKTIKYDFEGYKEVSYILYNTIASYTLDIEAVSCDELYADITTILQQSNFTPMEFATIVRDEIKNKTGCPVSTGFGSNKLRARLATRRAKPDGQFYLKDINVQMYIGNMSVRDIPGVGYTIMRQLKKLNVHTCSDLQGISLSVLQNKFGKKTGEMLYNTCRGIDLSKLNVEHVRKSVSSEVNYGIRFENNNDACDFLKKLSMEVVSRLIKINAKGRCITLKLMVRAKDAPIEPAKFMGHGLCDNFTKSKNLLTPTDDEVIITKEVLSLWEQLQQLAHEIRGIGIQISRLEILKKPLDNYMMKFIAKAKQSTTNSVNNIEEKITKPIIVNTQLPEMNNLHGSVKKEELKVPKRQDLQTFFAVKKSTKPSEKFNYSPTEIDKEILNELPLDIKNEILSSMNKTTNVNSKKKLKALQSQPENYFKHAKQAKYDKEKMPNIEQLDMKVLIELPDDIRNEILNHYKTNQNNIVINDVANQNGRLDAQNSRIFTNELNVSFSQVDPEFLSALSEEMRNDVKRYCMANKREKISKFKKTLNEAIDATSHPVKVQNLIHTNKRGRKPKIIQNNGILKLQSVSKTKIGVKKNIKQKNDANQLVHRNQSFLEHEINILQDDNVVAVKDRRNDIKSHRSSFRGNSANSEEHQEMLMNLVNHLFNLPMRQVKNQIETWISKCSDVNEIDVISIATFLSMLPKERRIEDLHILMRTMHRCMTEIGSCVWHETYSRTVEHVQHYMQIEYNSNLMLPPIRCNFRECKSNHV